jgi:2-keto-4-pentenoate hydratase/2-oxohepta-3-ene-1,7-dioic acid hydratase in catechol pathway
MRLIRFFDEDGRARWGSTAGEGLARPACGSVFGAWSLEEKTVAVAGLLPPAEPPNIFAIGRNYREHAREMNAEGREDEPLVFIKATTSLLPPGGTIRLPPSAPEEVDYEAELAVVIGRLAKEVPQDRALDYVLGYTCGNDVSARECQKRDRQWARAKSFDTFCPLGPALVTADELRPDRLAIRSILNGKTMQEADTSQMIFPVPALIGYLSRQFTLLPGTVILTGTPQGVGVARTPPVFLRPGYEIAIEIEGIGRLVNRVAHPWQ